MNSSLPLANVNGFAFLSPAIEALGWTLLHFVWQGTVLALALACFLALSRRASPRIRYAAGCAALVCMCLGAVATFNWQMATIDVSKMEQPVAERIVTPLPRLIAPLGNSKDPNPTGIVTAASFPIEHDLVQQPRPALNTRFELETTAAPVTGIAPSITQADRFLDRLRPWLSWIVGLWAGGVALLAIRLAAGWRVIRRLRAQGEKPRDAAWSARLERLRLRLGVSAPVRLLSSASARVPMVIGWLRPVVLVPAGLLTGLSISQLEAILAHELAHIRRHDYLINLLQNVVETFFFYHPAVWWTSQQIRGEREHCCDDLAAATCGGPLDYARALTALAALRHSSGALGLAATGGSLVGRMRRLAGIDAPGPRLGWPVPALILVAGAATALFVANSASRSSEADRTIKPASKAKANSVCGRVLDAAGRPVASATLWLTAEDGNDFLPDGPPIVASAQSTPDGHFELTPSPPVLQQIAYFGIWSSKPGLALQCVEREGWSVRPIEISMKIAEPVSVLVHNPDGSPCSNATVAPLSAHCGAIPEIIRNRLIVRSTSDGRVDLLGMSAGTITGLRFETAELGVQCCRFPSSDWPVSGPAKIALRKTGRLTGRLFPPAGSGPDLSRIKLRLTTTFKPNDPERTAWSADLKFGLHDNGCWREDLTIGPDREGRFDVPKIAQGTVRIVAEVPDDLGYQVDRPDGPFLIIPGETVTVDIPLAKRVRVTRIIRDAQTKKPLPGVRVFLERKNEWIKSEADAQGTVAAWIHADVPYQVYVELPTGYIRRNAASFQPVLAPSGAVQRSLAPIELSRERRLHGTVVDPQGHPLAGVRVGADWHVPDEEPERGRADGGKARKWTITDSEGRFQFDDLVTGAEIRLTPVRAQITLAEPLRVEPGDDKLIRLQTQRLDFVAIEERVVDRSGIPAAGVEVVIRVVRSNETVDALHLRTDPSGRYRSPAYFPKHLEYRVAVRSRCQDVVSSAPRTLSKLSTQFPDLVIGRPDPPQFSKLAGTEVIAVVNGEPILASEIFERAYPEPLNSEGLSLLVANKYLASGRETEAELRSLQDAAINKYLKDYIRTRVLARALEAKLEKEQKDKIEEAIGKMFDEYVDKLKIDLKVEARIEVERKLRQQGTSLDSLRKEFRYRILADEYVRSMQNSMHVSRESMEAYYRNHQQDYRFPEQVRWQLLEVSVVRHNSRQQARALAEKAATALRQGEDFASVVGKYSDGPGFEDGLDPFWTRLDDPADQHLSAAMLEIAAGDIKPLFDDRGAKDFKIGQQRGPDNALNVMHQGAKRLRRREGLEQVVRDYFDHGGKQPWRNPASLTDPSIEAALGRLAPGAISPVLEGSHSFRIVRLIERSPAGCAPFEEVEPSIRRTMQDQLRTKILDDLYRQATIESPYLGDDQHVAR